MSSAARLRPLQVVRWPESRRRCFLRSRSRPTARAARSERRGQVDLLQHGQRPTATRRQDRFASTITSCRHAAARYLASRRWPHVPDCRDLQFDDRAENVQMALVSRERKLFGLWKPARSRYADEALPARTGWHGRDAHRACGVLAYGDVKRVELAIALANRPKLLLMDEPTAGMAPKERNELMALTKQPGDRAQIGVLFTEHSMDVVSRTPTHDRARARQADCARATPNRSATTRACRKSISAPARPFRPTPPASKRQAAIKGRGAAMSEPMLKCPASTRFMAARTFFSTSVSKWAAAKWSR